MSPSAQSSIRVRYKALTHTLTFTFIAPHADSLGPHSPARSLSIRVAVPGSRGVLRVCSSRPSRASCGSRAHGAIARADSAPSLTTHLDLLAPSGAAPVTAAPIVIYTIPSSSCWSELLPPAHSCSYDAGLGAVRSLTLGGVALGLAVSSICTHVLIHTTSSSTSTSTSSSTPTSSSTSSSTSSLATTHSLLRACSTELAHTRTRLVHFKESPIICVSKILRYDGTLGQSCIPNVAAYPRYCAMTAPLGPRGDCNSHTEAQTRALLGARGGGTGAAMRCQHCRMYACYEGQPFKPGSCHARFRPRTLPTVHPRIRRRVVRYFAPPPARTPFNTFISHTSLLGDGI